MFKNSATVTPDEQQEDLDCVAQELRTNISVKDRRHILNVYKSCFIGSDAVKSLINMKRAQSEDEAVQLGNLLIANNLIFHVTNKSEPFRNNNSYYRFQEDEKFHGDTAKDSSGNTISFWQTFTSGVFNDGETKAVKDLLPDLPWEKKVLQEGITEVAEQMPPFDEHNVKLLDNVHPSTWQNPEPLPMYNLVVVGAGAGGLVSSIGAVGLGAKVAIVESNLFGGDCTNFGCVPSKALIESAKVAHTIRNAEKYGVETEGNVRVNFPKVMERMRKIRAEISDFDSAARLSSLGIDVFIGKGVFDSPNSLIVDGKKLKFKKCIICSGGKAYIPSIPGLSTVSYLTNESLFNLTELPKRLIVVGGGPIGMEMAQAFQRFGSQVTVLVRGAKILDKEDEDAALVVQKEIEKDGVRILTHCQQKEIRTTEDGGVAVSLSYKESDESEDVDRVIEADKILMATGRRPTVLGMGLDAAKVKYSETDGIEVNDFLCTSNNCIFAAGDCCSKFQFTHAADAMARICIQNALFFGSAKFSQIIMPWCTFTEPEIAHVGLYPRDLHQRKIKFDTFVKEFSENDRSVCEGNTIGFVKIHVKTGTDQIIGSTIVGENAGDMISEVTALMHGGVGLYKLGNVIHPYPTRAEAIRQTGDQYFHHSLSPFTRSIMKGILSWSLK